MQSMLTIRVKKNGQDVAVFQYDDSDNNAQLCLLSGDLPDADAAAIRDQLGQGTEAGNHGEYHWEPERLSMEGPAIKEYVEQPVDSFL
jgi:hypothetical protein